MSIKMKIPNCTFNFRNTCTLKWWIMVVYYIFSVHVQEYILMCMCALIQKFQAIHLFLYIHVHVYVCLLENSQSYIITDSNNWGNRKSFPLLLQYEANAFIKWSIV